MSNAGKVRHEAVAYRAKWVLPVDRPPLDGGIVTTAGGRIVAVGKNESGKRPRDLGNVALVPGMVNAHTHLEFSLSPQLGQVGMPFPEWLAEVINYRAAKKQNATSEEDRQCSRAGELACGYREVYESGTVAVGEIAPRDMPIEEYTALDQPLEITLFGELIGLAGDRVQSLMDQGRQYIQQTRVSELHRFGLSPHATYTIHPELLQQVCRLSAEKSIPVAMHIAESREELELLDSQTGPLVDFLKSLGAWHPASILWRSKPLDYLKQLAVASRSLVVHGNYLTVHEIEYVAGQHERMSVVFCPRTHAYFGHERYPLSEMLSDGVRVAVGTDSRASNPDLRLFEELRHIAEHHPDVEPGEILRMGTLAGAEALGLAEELGSITVGKLARLVVVSLGESASSGYESLFTSAAGSARPLK